MNKTIKCIMIFFIITTIITSLFGCVDLEKQRQIEDGQYQDGQFFVEDCLGMGGQFKNGYSNLLKIISSYNELSQIFDRQNVEWGKEPLITRYSSKFFDNNCLVLCFYYDSDNEIKRQIKDICVDGKKLKVEVLDIVPDGKLSSDGQTLIINQDLVYITLVAQVKKSMVAEITEVEYSTRYILESKIK